MTLDEIKRFRQLGSEHAGHPEYGHTPGVETTTGPLGQGLATAVGMAIAERHMAAVFGDSIVDHKTYVIASDGDLMEGISHEAIALAGHLKLNKLIVLFDDNGISIDGALSLSDSVDQVKRFEACGWNAWRIDGHDPDGDRRRAGEGASLRQAGADRLQDATSASARRPRPASRRRTARRSAPTRSRARAKRSTGTTRRSKSPTIFSAAWRSAGARGQAGACRLEQAPRRARRRPSAPSSSAARRANCRRPRSTGAVRQVKESLAATPKDIATRSSSEFALETLVPALPEMIGGSADLTGSNNTRTKSMQAMTAADFSGRFIHYGVREHGMAAAMNGMALHGGIIPYCGTFLVFSDYCRPAIRLAALMGVRGIHVMTHDSIGLGEDGPTHQPVEHLAALRAIPNLLVFRPADAVETVECWQLALQNKDRPSVLALTRQGLPQLSQGFPRQQPLRRRRLRDFAGRGQGRRLDLRHRLGSLARRRGAEAAQAKGVAARVVSVPCFELLAEAPEAARRAVIGDAKVKIGVEAAVRQGWDAIIGSDGAFIGMTRFGASAPYKELYKHFGITPEAVADVALRKLGKT